MNTTSFSNMVWIMSVSRSIWQSAGWCWAIAVSTWSSTRSWCSWCIIWVSTWSSFTFSFGCSRIAWSFWTWIGVRWWAIILFSCWWIRIRILLIRTTWTAWWTVSHGVIATGWGRYRVRRYNWPRWIRPPGCVKITFINHFCSLINLKSKKKLNYTLRLTKKYGEKEKQIHQLIN